MRASFFIACILMLTVSKIILSLPIQWVEIAAPFTGGTENQIVEFATSNAIARYHPLRVGSSLVANRKDASSLHGPVYQFYRSKFDSPLLQGKVSDSGIIGIYATLLTESKLLLVASSFTFQQSKFFTVSYNAATDQYAEISRTVPTTTLRGFAGLVADPTATNTAYWLGVNRNLYRWDLFSSFGSFCTTSHSNTPQLLLYWPTIIVFGGTSPVIEFVALSTLSIANTLTGRFRGH